MATHFSARSLFGVFAVAIAAALVSGCSGSQGSLPAAGGQAVIPPQIKNHCPGHGGVRANPCSADFTASSYGPVTVTIRVPKDKKGTLSESDNCGGASGIASVTANPSDPNQYVVAAGATTGYCTATFSYNSFKHGKLLGYADVNITNSI
jgi:hypothetical protein